MSMISSQINRRLDRATEINLGQFRFIEVREQAGSDAYLTTPERKKVFDLSAVCLLERMNADDLLMRGPDGFLITFADPNETKAAILTERLIGMLNEFYSGHQEMHGLDIEAEARVLTRSSLGELLTSSLKLETLKRGRRRVQLKTRFDGIDAAQRFWEYIPVWDSRNSVCLSSEAVARASLNTGEFFRREVLLGENTALDHQDLDLQAIRTVVDDVAKSDLCGTASRVYLALHLDGLSHKTCNAAYMEALRDIPAEVKPNLRLCVEGVGPVTQASRIMDALAPIQRMEFRVGVMLPILFDLRQLRAFRDADLTFMGVQWPSQGQGLQFGLLSELIREAALIEVPVHMFGVADAHVFSRAVQYGARLLSGPAVGDPARVPVRREELAYKAILDRAEEMSLTLDQESEDYMDFDDPLAQPGLRGTG